MGSRVGLFAAIRRDERVEGLSIRELAQRHGVHRRTVRAALTDAEPPPRKVTVRAAPRLDPYKDVIEKMLTADVSAPRKQRHTARRVHARLLEEHDAAGLSYSTVRDWVRVRRAVIDLEAGRRVEVFVAQEHAPAAEAEVDFGEVWVVLAEVKTKCHMFVFRMSHSGKAIHRVYPTQGQEAFLEGHLAAFGAIGGVPTRHIRYDNLTSAVSQVLHQGGTGTGGGVRGRKENERWVLFRSHYGFDAFYCQPGITGAHEKGGVEGEVGRFRRNRLTPMPVVDSLDELNARIIGWETTDDRRRITGRLRTVGEDFATEQPLLAPLPVERFDPGLVLHPRVDRSSMITVRMARYSVPAHLIGRRVRVSLRASELVIFDGRTAVARHERVTTRAGTSVLLDHYLEVFTTKPGALPGSSVLAAARRTGVFTASHDAFWAASRRVNGEAAGTRELVDVLLLHRSMTHEQVVAGIEAALHVGAVTADVVAVEARRQPVIASRDEAAVNGGGAGAGRHTTSNRGAHPRHGERQVVNLTQRRLTDPAAVIAGLPPDLRPVPSVAAYDELLPRRHPQNPDVDDVAEPTAAP